MTEIGLPYAADPAVTKHLARFLTRQESGERSLPTALLFNGGVFQAAGLRDRVSEVVKGWSGGELRVLENADLDLAVARGAAYYGMVRRGKGIRIRGGVPRSYYIGIETTAPAVPGVSPPVKAMCVVPMGMEEGTESDVPGSELGLVVGEPAEFRFLSSTVRKDPIGTVLDRWPSEELTELSPLQSDLPARDGKPGEVVPVKLHSSVTEVGTLDLSFRSTKSEQSWKLEFDVRDPAES